MPPLDAQMLESLEAIDATLAGEAVDPRHAELAELALLLRAERPEVSMAMAAELDQRVRERFAPRPAALPAVRRSRRRWLYAPAIGLAASVVIAVVIVVSSGPGPTGIYASSSSAASSPAATTPIRAAAGAAVRHIAKPSAEALAVPRAGTPSPTALAGSHVANPSLAALATSQSVNSVASGAVAAPLSQAAIVSPPPNGRKIVQAAQLALITSASRIDTVAQEVFNVAGRENAIVQNSSVTQGAGGYAQFQLSIPSGSLGQAMALLSTLPYAHVSSRTDTSQDVNNQYVGDVNRLADARALRTALLKQLANAVTTAQVDSLTAQIHDAEASISSDEATLRGLSHQIDFSQVTVTVNSGATPVPVAHTSRGFTLSRAAHDAGRVLTVAAGVALIGLAALVPFALLTALGWWVRTLMIRRRREHALDLV
jgi:hypothetical protein